MILNCKKGAYDYYSPELALINLEMFQKDPKNYKMLVFFQEKLLINWVIKITIFLYKSNTSQKKGAFCIIYHEGMIVYSHEIPILKRLNSNLKIYLNDVLQERNDRRIHLEGFFEENRKVGQEFQITFLRKTKTLLLKDLKTKNIITLEGLDDENLCLAVINCASGTTTLSNLDTCNIIEIKNQNFV